MSEEGASISKDLADCQQDHLLGREGNDQVRYDTYSVKIDEFVERDDMKEGVVEDKDGVLSNNKASTLDLPIIIEAKDVDVSLKSWNFKGEGEDTNGGEEDVR